MLLTLLLVVNLALIGLTALFWYESVREAEPRAPKVARAALIGLAVILVLVLFLPAVRPAAAWLFGAMAALGLILLIPGPANKRAVAGARGLLVEEAVRFDERDVIFARNRTIVPGSDQYDEYYRLRPEKKERDDARRAKGGPIGRAGAIDGGYRSGVAMMDSGFGLPPMLGPHAVMEPDPGVEPAELDPAKAAETVKGYARHVGADLVGICRTDSAWVYSRRGEIFYDNWADWGQELPDPLPYAVVVAVEMAHDLVMGAPHTPTTVESSHEYAKGAYISTLLAAWFRSMGHRAAAQHSRHYDLNMVPLAIDAGLGELGRLGYLIANKFGPRVRLFAVTTDMPLAVDEPIDLGAEVFCRRCLKCAESCPSSSIPQGEMTVHGGALKWKLDEASCFDYWAKVGTDCSACMAICPFSRPNRTIHRLVRWLIRRPGPARYLLPYIDNFIYGRRWKPRPVPDWVAWPKTESTEGEKEGAEG